MNEKKSYKREDGGRIMIEYGCGHSFSHRFSVERHFGAETKSFELHGFSIDDDLSLCSICRAKKIQAEMIERLKADLPTMESSEIARVYGLSWTSKEERELLKAELIARKEKREAALRKLDELCEAAKLRGFKREEVMLAKEAVANDLNKEDEPICLRCRHRREDGLCLLTYDPASQLYFCDGFLSKDEPSEPCPRCGSLRQTKSGQTLPIYDADAKLLRNEQAHFCFDCEYVFSCGEAA